LVSSKGEAAGKAANFICVWYSPPFSDGWGNLLPEKTLSQMAESSMRRNALRTSLGRATDVTAMEKNLARLEQI
jgi:hypothetical protein